MRFLIIDDSAVDRRFLKSLLEELGHQAEAHDSPVGVIDKIAMGRYASIFLDIVMPHQDGYKFLRELRANQSTLKQHVILYSSKKTPIEVNYGLQRAGANAYLSKPISRQRLEEVLRNLR